MKKKKFHLRPNPSRSHNKMMSSLEWKEIKYFKPMEFISDELDVANPNLIIELDQVRHAIGIPIHPSPAPGALAREQDFAKKLLTQHAFFLDIDNFKLSQAIDVFIPNITQTFESFIHFHHLLLASSNFRGVGYNFGRIFQGKPTLLLHLDLRDIPCLWLSIKYKKGNALYFYPETEKTFNEKLSFYWDKQKKFEEEKS